MFLKEIAGFVLLKVVIPAAILWLVGWLIHELTPTKKEVD